MDKQAQHTTGTRQAVVDRDPLTHDEAALNAARHNPDQRFTAPDYGPWCGDIVKLLNDSLATELVCMLRYKRHHFTASSLSSPEIAEEFMAHALEESAHADRIAQRISELGGVPDFSPNTLVLRSHASYDDSSDLTAMIRANLVAERVSVEVYGQMISLIGDKDSTTRHLLEDLLSAEQAHAEELTKRLSVG